MEQKLKRLGQEEREESSRQRVIKKELEWVRQSPRARQAKSKARITAYDDLVRASEEISTDTAQIVIPIASRLGNLVIESKGVTKSYGDKNLIHDLDFLLPPGAIVGVIGPNGAGKTTLFRMITGQEEPDSGSIRLGETSPETLLTPKRLFGKKFLKGRTKLIWVKSLSKAVLMYHNSTSKAVTSKKW